MEEGGFIYDSDAYNDELPYWLEFPNKAHLVIPYSLTTNDSKFGRGWFSTSDDFLNLTKMPSIYSTKKARQHQR